MFHGNTSRGAFLVTDSSLSVRETSGEKRRTAPGRAAAHLRDPLENGAHQAPTPRVTGDDQSFRCQPSIHQMPHDRDDVLGRGGEGKLRSQSVICDEGFALRDPGQVGHEECVHPR